MKRLSLIIGSVVILAFLAGATFVGAWLLSGPEAAAQPSGGGRVMEMVNDDGSGPVHLRLSVEPAPELPDRPAETSGLFVRREDNSLFIGTGAIEVDVEVDGATGEESVSANHSGPTVEVVVNHETILYQDVTALNIEPSADQSGEQTIQQVVQPASSLEAVGENTELEVWGERRGDRVIAEVVVYRPVR